MYPTISEYLEAIKSAEDNFEQLKHLRPVLEDDGSPIMTSGNFAVVFKMKDEQTGKLHAVKCFLREQEGRAEAYRQIAEELEFVSSTFLTPIKYLDKELFVDTNAGDEKEFPVLLMDWVEGETLDKYIRKRLDDQYELSLLAYQFSRLAMWLMPQPFAHGDLKPDNILVKSDGTLVLVDYDGMYVPAMKGQKARELGSPDFRHPSRTETDFDEHIDDFSLASILLSLKALSLQSSLLEEYGAQDRLLFSEKDYHNLSESKVMDALKPFMQDAELASLYSLFILAASQNNLSGVSFRLFYLNRPSVSSPKKSMRVLQINKKIVNQSNQKIIKKELLASFQGKKNVWHILLSNGTSSYLTQDWSFNYEASAKGACKLNTVENDKKHVLFLFNDRDAEVGRYYIGEKLRGLTPKQLTEIKHELCFFEAWNPETNKWVPCVGKSKESVKKQKLENEYQRTEVTKEDWEDAEIDEYCVVYNHKRLLSGVKLEEYEIKYGTEVICDHAFEEIFDSAILKHITIPNSVKAIGYSSFCGCALEEIELPDSLLYIGADAFSECFNIKTLHFPNSLVTIDNGAFQSCTSLKEVYLPASLKNIGRDMMGYDIFYGCKSLNHIFVPKGKRSYFEELLPEWKDKLIEQDEDKNLRTEVTDEDLENAWTDVYGVIYSADKKRLLRTPNNLKEYSILTGTKVICDKAFNWCEDEDSYVLTYNDTLESIMIPDTVVRIGNHAFRNCLVLDGIVMPKSLRFIGNHAFSGCKALSEVNLPESVMEIGDAAFYGCESLTSINIPNSLTKLSDSVFSECAFSQISIPDTIKEIDNYAFYLCKNLKSISVPTSVNKFGVGLFGGCSSLIEVELPNTLDELGYEFFSGCVSLSEIAIPLSVEIIGDRAFQHCHSITEIVIPDKVSTIGAGAFGGCSSLRSIVIPDGVTLLGNSAFEDCSSLQSVKISKSVSIIGNLTFSGCTALQSINIPNGVTDIEDSFWGCMNLSCISIPNSVTYIGDNIFMECYSLKEIRIPNGRKDKFEKMLPYYKDLLVEQYEEENLSTEITDEDLKNAWTDEYGVMYSADRKRLLKAPVDLIKYSIPEGTKVICNGYASGYDWGRRKIGAFNGCAVLTRVEIPNSVTHIGYKAFYNCSNLTTLVLPDSMVSFGEQVFDGCFQLQKIIIPFGTKDKYHFWLAQFSHKFVEQIKGWTVKSTRHFNPEEIAAVCYADVITTQYGLSARFSMKNGDKFGGYKFIPLSTLSTLSSGDTIDMNTAKLITLCKDGEDDIVRVIEQ